MIHPILWFLPNKQQRLPWSLWYSISLSFRIAISCVAHRHRLDMFLDLSDRPASLGVYKFNQKYGITQLAHEPWFPFVATAGFSSEITCFKTTYTYTVCMFFVNLAPVPWFLTAPFSMLPSIFSEFHLWSWRPEIWRFKTWIFMISEIGMFRKRTKARMCDISGQHTARGVAEHFACTFQKIEKFHHIESFHTKMKNREISLKNDIFSKVLFSLF